MKHAQRKRIGFDADFDAFRVEVCQLLEDHTWSTWEPHQGADLFDDPLDPQLHELLASVGGELCTGD